MVNRTSFAAVDDGDQLSEGFFNDANNFGAGGLGAFSSTGTHNFTQGTVYEYTTFDLQAGHTLTAAAGSGFPIIIKVLGSATIAGSIILKGLGYAADDGFNVASVSPQNSLASGVRVWIPLGIGTPGTPGWGSSNGVSNGIGGVAFPAGMFMNKNTGSYLIAGGAGGGSGDRGGSGSSLSAGGGGGAGYADNGDGGGTGGDGSSEGAGAAGGGAILMFVGGDLNFTGTIDIRGNDSAGGALVATGGGGGGGMGWFLVSGTITDSGTKLVSGGLAGTTTVAGGGNGGNGAVKIEAWDGVY
jgi:hypothetical protein